jgi:hypothetical protein
MHLTLPFLLLLQTMSGFPRFVALEAVVPDLDPDLSCLLTGIASVSIVLLGCSTVSIAVVWQLLVLLNLTIQWIDTREPLAFVSTTIVYRRSRRSPNV